MSRIFVHHKLSHLSDNEMAIPARFFSYVRSTRHRKPESGMKTPRWRSRFATEVPEISSCPLLPVLGTLAEIFSLLGRRVLAFNSAFDRLFAMLICGSDG